MRTTVDIYDPFLKNLKKIQQKEGKSLGRLISDLLAQALGERRSGKPMDRPAKWISKPMGAHQFGRQGGIIHRHGKRPKADENMKAI